MTNRSASEQLKWYFYQFDKTILELLVQESDDIITVEWVEDIDSVTENTQVKHYTATRIILGDWSKSRAIDIAKAVTLLLVSFSTEQKNTRLYWLFKDNTPGIYIVTMEELNEYISLAHSQINEEQRLIIDSLSEVLKQSFINGLTIETWPSFDDQRALVISKICEEFSITSQVEAENIFNYCLKRITHLACQSEISSRQIQKSQLIDDFRSNKEVLANSWYIERIGHKKYLQEIKNEHFKYWSVMPIYERCFIFNLYWNESIDALKEIILKITSKFYPQRRWIIHTYPPYLCFLGISEENILSLKNALWNEGHKFQDGYFFRNSRFRVEDISRKYNVIIDHFKMRFIHDLNELWLVLLSINDRTTEIYHFVRDGDDLDISNIEGKIYKRIRINSIWDLKSLI